MALEFFHVKLLRYSHNPVFFEAGLRYRIEKKLTITGRLADLQNQEGVGSLLSKERAVLTAATDYDDIILNGINFGQGRIESVSFEGGLMVRDEDYTYEITCYEEGNLFNGTNGVYQGIVWTDAEKIESLNESFEFQEEENGDRTYTHSVEVQFSDYSSVADGTNKAKALAAVFFNATSGLGAFLGTYTNVGSAKKLYTESYNLIDCSCSFTETCVIPRERAGNYSYSLSYTLEQREDGFTTISESCTIKGLTNPRFAGALEGMSAMSAGVFTRCSSVYSEYPFSNSPLFQNPISRSVSIDKFTGEITLETSFTNDPRYQPDATWDYTLEGSRDSQGYYTITESGSVIGHGRPLKDKYLNAKNFFNTTVSPNIPSRINNFYQQISGRSLTLILTNQSDAQDEYEGTIQYSRTYTDNNLYSNGAIRKVEASITVAKPVHLVQRYNIFNQKEVVQPQNQATLGSVTYDIQLKGKRGTTLSVYLNAAKALVNANLPATSDRFIESVQYDLSPQTNSFGFSLTMKYAGSFKAFTDIKVD